ncbi:hypothetical protein DFH11DRAFT_1056006 [Phellopilus nigrolimitatus]|nr:hypothetical protein DFH11DRAFT_1056006 [Phellopilus nigrolimitatus]
MRCRPFLLYNCFLVLYVAFTFHVSPAERWLFAKFPNQFPTPIFSHSNASKLRGIDRRTSELILAGQIQAQDLSDSAISRLYINAHAKRREAQLYMNTRNFHGKNIDPLIFTVTRRP